jgi:carbamoyl-phosphate synthase/aspartate carbamoyltransferase/dihydroorotase
VTVVPWDYPHLARDAASGAYDGVFLSSGPGDPQMCHETIEQLRRVLANEEHVPIFGICLGHQLLSVAIGCSTMKMKYVE